MSYKLPIILSLGQISDLVGPLYHRNWPVLGSRCPNYIAKGKGKCVFRIHGLHAWSETPFLWHFWYIYLYNPLPALLKT